MPKLPLKTFAKKLMPPVLWDLARSAAAGDGSEVEIGPFTGPIGDWGVAEASSESWDSDVITRKTFEVSLKVKNGEVRFQQDTIPCERILYSEAILAFLAVVAQRHDGRIEIIDFGGSLGTNYFQNAHVLREAIRSSRLRWLIVERPNLVRLGTKHFATSFLKFFPDLGALAAAEPQVPRSVLFSGSLQYVDKPLHVLEETISLGADTIAFDRLLVSENTEDRIFVQHPNRRAYYDVSYPVWAFSRAAFRQRMRAMGFDLIDEFPQLPTGNFRHFGMVFTRQEQRP